MVVRIVLIGLVVSLLVSGEGIAAQVQLVVDRDPATPVQHAIDDLVGSLRGHRIDVIRCDRMDATSSATIVIGEVAASPIVAQLVQRHRLAVPDRPESLLIKHLAPAQGSMVLLTGRDQRGLMYAVREAAEAIRLAPPDGDVLRAVGDAQESPHLRVRSVTIQLFNADLEEGWYYNEAHWRNYFAMLARNRFNNFTLTFGHQTNYLTPPYPWLFALPDYSDVHVDGLSAADRATNLRMLRSIAVLATEYGVDFNVGLWTQRPVQDGGMTYGPTAVRNFPEGEKGRDYCARGLARLLQECPEIRGVQFRMNDESGVPDSQQEEYYQALFDGVKSCGHQVRLDLRYKELKQRTIDQAIRTGLDVTVSTKFWCEHMGLPFHPTIQDAKYSASRYGYGSLLSHPRNFRLVYQLWTVGTSRILLWGDPAYASRFALACEEGGGDGFEVFAPLSFRGYGNEPGVWDLFCDPKLTHGEWDHERYWMFYRVLGCMGYNPATHETAWQGELEKRFGPSARDVARAYEKSGQILPLITATCQFSAGGWGFWPEMSTCMPLDSYAVIQPSDYGQFYAISRWRPVDSWRSESWSSDHSGFVEDAVAGTMEAKWTPVQVSRRLSQLADETLASVAAATVKQPDNQTADFRATMLDFRILAHLARYHAAKKIAATHLEFFRATNEPGRLPQAMSHARDALAAWSEIVRLSDGAYHDDLVFGFSDQMAAQYGYKLHVHTGHWKDRLPEVVADVDYLAKLIAKHGATNGSYTHFPGEEPPTERPVIRHVPVPKAIPGKEVEVVAQVESATPLRAVVLHYRPMNQTYQWKAVPMQADADKESFRAAIPGDDIERKHDMQYYLEARIEGGGTLWPDWEKRTPYVVLPVHREEP
jgi:hypothetical protein